MDKSNQAWTPDKALTVQEVIDITAMSRASIYNMMATGTFPKPIRPGGRGGSVRWLMSDIQNWFKHQRDLVTRNP